MHSHILPVLSCRQQQLSSVPARLSSCLQTQATAALHLPSTRLPGHISQ